MKKTAHIGRLRPRPRIAVLAHSRRLRHTPARIVVARARHETRGRVAGARLSVGGARCEDESNGQMRFKDDE